MATYEEIQDYVKSRYGFVPKTCWIAHMKELCGIPVKQAPNRFSITRREVPCPPDKMEAIRNAFRYFGMIKENEIKSKKSNYVENLHVLRDDIADLTKNAIIEMFNVDMLRYHEFRKRSGYEASIIENSIHKNGGYETALKFCNGTAKKGFLELSKRGLLNYSLEALVIKPEYSTIFTPEMIVKCRKLLEQYGYNDMN